MYSVIIPVYRNEESLPELIAGLEALSASIQARHGQPFEVVMVVDGCPGRCHEILRSLLPAASFPAQLVLHARNFGSFAAIRTGLKAARGAYFGVISADLQEPLDLLERFLEILARGEADIVVGQREGREDPALSRLSSSLFWGLYRRWVMREIPPGGVDLFGGTRQIRDHLLGMTESHGSLVGQLFWLGFRRRHIGYVRRARKYGRSAWRFSAKLTYMLDSIFAFTDLPIRVLTAVGLVGIVLSIAFAALVTVLRLVGDIQVPGYSASAVLITFFGGANLLGLGIVGSYAWRAYENSKRRPLALVQSVLDFGGKSEGPI
jgi:glycosyltransferase involved in cell wall biosynthesis